MWVEPTAPGHYEIGCAQLCGVGHSIMRGDVYVHTQEEFDQWLKGQSAKTAAAAAASKAQPTETW